MPDSQSAMHFARGLCAALGFRRRLATPERSAVSYKKPMEGERVVSVVAAAIGFVVFSASAVFAIVVANDVALWIRAMFVLAACFFGWLLFLALQAFVWRSLGGFLGVSHGPAIQMAEPIDAIHATCENAHA